MDKNISDKIKELVADNELEQALDLLIHHEQNKNRERYHTLILLKGKLEMLEEQELADLLPFDDLAREKRKIAHALLQMTDGTTPDTPAPGSTQQAEVQKTVAPSPRPAAGFSKYWMVVAMIAAAASIVFYLTKNPPSENPAQEQPSQNVEKKEQEKTPGQTTDSSRGPLRLLDFPNIGRPFNFSDIQYHFKDVQVEQYSGTEIKLTLKMDLVCRSNLGICYREETRIVVDGNPVAPIERKAWEGYLEHNASAKEELSFVFETGNNYRLLLEKNSSTWERPFKILQ